MENIIRPERIEAAKTAAKEMTYAKAQEHIKDLHWQGVELRKKQERLQEEEAKERTFLCGLLLAGGGICILIVAIAFALV